MTCVSRKIILCQSKKNSATPNAETRCCVFLYLSNHTIYTTIYSTIYSTIQSTVPGIALAQPSRPHTLRAGFPKHRWVSCNGSGDPSPNSEAGRVCSGEVKLPNWVWRQVLCVGIQGSIEPQPRYFFSQRHWYYPGWVPLQYQHKSCWITRQSPTPPTY